MAPNDWRWLLQCFTAKLIFSIIDKEPTETQSDLFAILNKDQKESDVNVSGKLLTNEEKIDNKEYLDSIEGLQINIEGSFQ